MEGNYWIVGMAYIAIRCDDDSINLARNADDDEIYGY